MDDLVRVTVVESEPAALIAVSVLESEGIEAMWRKTEVGAMTWGSSSLGGMTGPIEVLVRPADAPRAQELLATDD